MQFCFPSKKLSILLARSASCLQSINITTTVQINFRLQFLCQYPVWYWVELISCLKKFEQNFDAETLRLYCCLIHIIWVCIYIVFLTKYFVWQFFTEISNIHTSLKLNTYNSEFLLTSSFVYILCTFWVNSHNSQTFWALRSYICTL